MTVDIFWVPNLGIEFMRLKKTIYVQISFWSVDNFNESLWSPSPILNIFLYKTPLVAILIHYLSYGQNFIQDESIFY
jgi:hypothetical protein